MIGIVVNKYNNLYSSSPIHQLCSDYGESCTDTSKWRPSISTVRAFLGNPGSSRKSLQYDYPDGKDDGNVIRTFLRTKGLDITEIETAEKRITQIVEDQVANAKLSQKQKDDYNKAIKDLSDAMKDNNGDFQDPKPDENLQS